MRQPQDYWPHFAALGHAIGGYCGGLGLLLAEPVGPNLLGEALSFLIGSAGERRNCRGWC